MLAMISCIRPVDEQHQTLFRTPNTGPEHGLELGSDQLQTRLRREEGQYNEHVLNCFVFPRLSSFQGHQHIIAVAAKPLESYDNGCC